jgi:hypothetical protein
MAQKMEEKMNNVFAVIGLILQLIPALIATIRAIEEAIPGEGMGEQKLAAVRGILEAAEAGSLAIWPALEKVIAVLVATFNATGVFKKS